MTSLIETNIPMPAGRAGDRASKPEYEAWRKLEVGQSVFLARRKLSTVMVYKSSKAMAVQRTAGQEWRVAAVEKDGVPGIRVWRSK